MTAKQMLRWLSLLALLVVVFSEDAFADDSSEICAGSGLPCGSGNAASGSSLMQAKQTSRRVVMADWVEDPDVIDGAPSPSSVEPLEATADSDVVMVEHTESHSAADGSPSPSPVEPFEAAAETIDSEVVMAEHTKSHSVADGSPSPSPVEPFEAAAETIDSEVIMVEHTENHSAAGGSLLLLPANSSAAAALIGTEPGPAGVQRPLPSGNASSDSSSATASGINSSGGGPRMLPPAVSLLVDAGGERESLYAEASRLTDAFRGAGGLGAGVVIMFAMVLVLVGLMAFVLLMNPDASSGTQADTRVRLSQQSSPAPEAFKGNGNFRSGPKMQAKSSDWLQPVSQTSLAPSRPPSAVILPASVGDRAAGPVGGDTAQRVPEMEVQAQFCPDLVVPQGCECILVVPTRPVAVGAPFDVADVNGNVVLRVSQTASGARRILLATAHGDPLAQCCAARPSCPPGVRGAAEFHLSRASGEFFARLTRSESQDRFALSMHSGARLHFWGSFEHHAVNITDDSGRLLATTEVCTVDFDASGKYYRLRVAPLSDVGLVLSSLLCIDHLGEGQL